MIYDSHNFGATSPPTTNADPRGHGRGVLTLEAAGCGPPTAVRIRRLLKAAQRAHGLKRIGFNIQNPYTSPLKSITPPDIIPKHDPVSTTSPNHPELGTIPLRNLQACRCSTKRAVSVHQRQARLDHRNAGQTGSRVRADNHDQTQIAPQGHVRK